MEPCAGKERALKKGRAKNEIITAMRRSSKKVMVKEISNATMECKLKHNENKWRIITVYSQKIEETLETVIEWIPKKNEKYLLVRGNFGKYTEKVSDFIGLRDITN